MASRHLTIRVDPDSFERLDRESRRQRRSRSEVARTLLEEGLRMESHPCIVFREGPAGRRPGLRNGADVWEVIGCFPDHKVSEAGIDHVMQMMDLSEWQVRDAMRYYFEFSGEIDDWIRMNNEAAERGYAEWLAGQTRAANE